MTDVVKVIRRKVIVDVQFGRTPREAVEDLTDQGESAEELRRELRRRLGR